MDAMMITARKKLCTTKMLNKQGMKSIDFFFMNKEIN